MNRTVNLLSLDGRTGGVEIDRSAESQGCRSGRPPFDQAIEGDITMRTNKLLWIVQGLLAALFLFAGGVKLVLPVEAVQQGPVALPGTFLRFIGVCEICGAAGLVLPWALRIRPVLTPLAASGLVIIMVGATVVTALSGPAAPALFPLIVAVLCGSVIYGRSRTLKVRAA
jgi:hypothetical protein